jgi:hypothetical protein
MKNSRKREQRKKQTLFKKSKTRYGGSHLYFQLFRRWRLGGLQSRLASDKK